MWKDRHCSLSLPLSTLLLLIYYFSFYVEAQTEREWKAGRGCTGAGRAYCMVSAIFPVIINTFNGNDEKRGFRFSKMRRKFIVSTIGNVCKWSGTEGGGEEERSDDCGNIQ